MAKSKSLATTNGGGTSVAVRMNLDRFKAFGDSAQGSQNIKGDLLGFNKGEWVAGQAKDEIELDTPIAVDMRSVLMGWQKWLNKKPAGMMLGAINDENYKPVTRNDLDDLDEESWPVDPLTRQPRDPWVETCQFFGRNMETGEIYTFSSSSHGGRNAVKALCRDYAKECIAEGHEGEMPVIELGRNFYIHKEHGKTWTPEFRIVDWTDDLDFEQRAPKMPTKAAPAKKRASTR